MLKPHSHLGLSLSYYSTHSIRCDRTRSVQLPCAHPVKLPSISPCGINTVRRLRLPSVCHLDISALAQFTLRIAGNATAEVNFTHTGILVSVDFARNPGDLACVAGNCPTQAQPYKCKFLVSNIYLKLIVRRNQNNAETWPKHRRKYSTTQHLHPVNWTSYRVFTASCYK